MEHEAAVPLREGPSRKTRSDFNVRRDSPLADGGSLSLLAVPCCMHDSTSARGNSRVKKRRGS